MNRGESDLIIRVTRAIAPFVSVALVAFGLAAASGASARDAGPGPASELASQLLPIRGGGDRQITAARQADLTISKAGRVLVQVYVSGRADAAVRRLEESGMSVSATADEPLPVVEGRVPATDLAAVAALEVTTAVMPVLAGGTDAGLVTSEGVAAHRIPQALSSGASTGEGVDVGVISDSIGRVGGGVGASQDSGDLPTTVTVLKEDFGADTIDEGRAMAEIIFDGATGIDSILFASGTAAGPADKADSIDQLVANGAEVIADDIFWLFEPFFQDGVVAQAVDRARAAGVTYIASAGNRARQSWEGTYTDAGGDPSFHDFDPGPGIDQVQALTTITNGNSIQLVFQWDEPWGSAANDMDVQLVKADGGPLPCAAQSGGEDDNPGVTKVPLEIVTWVNDCAGDTEVGLKINRFSGTLNPFMKYIARGGFASFNPEYATNSNTINPDAASADGALAVAAVDALDPGLDTPRPYSSRGPVSKRFDDLGQRLPSPEVRQKPELAAADGVATTVPGFELFQGTSAAVPSAASIAAILRSSNPAAPADEIERLMTDPANAIDCTESAAVPDPDCGAGFLLADLAFGALDRDGPVVTPVLTPARPNGRNGWYTRPVSLEWRVSDPGSPIASQDCPPVLKASDGIATLTCVATSGGGTSNAAVRIKLDSTKPKKPQIRGLKSRTYARSGKKKLPRKNKIRCRSKDRTSGLASCRIDGYSRKRGRHTLVAKATDKAGLSSVSRLRYRVR